MRNVNIPTTKSLETKLRLLPERARQIRVALEQWKQGGDLTTPLAAANRALRGFGVKPLWLEPETAPAVHAISGQALCYYVDRNDVEKPTLIYDSRLENFKVLNLSEFLDRQHIS